MLEILVDGSAVNSGRFELHHQTDPFPGDSRYLIRTSDRELRDLISQRFSPSLSKRLNQADVSYIFNFLSVFISLKFERTIPLFWANTIDHMIDDGEFLVIEGICSRHIV
jgi:hypothetical protein